MKFFAQRGRTIWWVVVVSLATGLRIAAETNLPPSPARFVIRSWQTGDGLPQNTVTTIAQTRDGYLYVATERQFGGATADGTILRIEPYEGS